MNEAWEIPETRQVCTFLLDGLLFGIEVEKVQEVVRHQKITAVPLAPSIVLGLINLRGHIVTVLDPRRCLQLSDRTSEQPVVHMVLSNNAEPVSLLVDEIGDVVAVDAQWFEPLPETVTNVNRDSIRGAYKLSDRLLLLLDTASMLCLAQRASDRACPMNS